MHWCADETNMLIALLSSIPLLGTWIRSKLSRKTFSVRQKKTP